MTENLPRIVLFNINGSGMGHLSRCLAYARQMRGRARPIFFSLASAIEVIEEMGFEADYFVSEFWSRAHINAWNAELAVRFGLFLEEVRPHAVLFDGTWPFHGFMDACDVARVPVRIWSNRGLHKAGFDPVPVMDSDFDLVIEPGEIGGSFDVIEERRPGRKIRTPPVAILGKDELLDRDEARAALGLPRDGRYALLSLGPGNLKDVGSIGPELAGVFRKHGFQVAWARAPITRRDVALPGGMVPISAFPLVRYLRAFDIFAGAAGYNSCCEIVQARLPSLLVPNELVADDQLRRAEMVSAYIPTVVSKCGTLEERQAAVAQLLSLADAPFTARQTELNGASLAVDEILALLPAKITA